MLPLLAAMLGNDYVEKKVFKKFFSQLKLPKTKRKQNVQQRCIHGLFKWLQNETLESAIEKILGRLKKNQKNKVLAIIKKSIEGYSRTDCKSLEYFDIDDNVSEIEYQKELLSDDHLIAQINTVDEECAVVEDGEISLNEEAVSENDSDSEDEELDNDNITEWFAESVRKNFVPQSYLNLYTHHLHFSSPQAEDYKEEDAFLCTLHILRYAFDILTDFSYDECIYVCRESDSNYKRLSVGREFSIPRLLNETIAKLSDEQLKSYFIHFLTNKMPALDLALIELLPNNIQLFTISLLWWVSTTKVATAHVHSLFLSYLMLEVIDEKTGSFRGNYYFNNKYSSKIEEFKNRKRDVTYDGEELFLNKNKVQYEDCLIAAGALIKHFELDDSIRKKPKSYDQRKMHCFAQFQCCLQQFNSLNTLCRQPFEPTKYSKCFNGTFVYNVSLKMENQADCVKFIDKYLNGALTVLMFYKSLFQIYEKCVEQMCLTTGVWTGKKRRRKKCANVDEELSLILKGFESEVVI